MLWKQSEDASQKSSWNDDTSNITRPLDSFSAVPPTVNVGDWGCIVLDLETIMVLVLLAFYFIPQWSHNSLTFTRSRLRVSATVTLMPGDSATVTHNSNESGVIGIIDQVILQTEKKLRCVLEEQ